MNLFSHVHSGVIDAIAELSQQGELPANLDLSRVAVEPPRESAHGDVSTNAAMVLARPSGQPPRALADLIAARPKTHPDI